MNENLNTNLEEGQDPHSEGTASSDNKTNAESSSHQSATKADDSSQVGDTPSTVLPQEVKANNTDSLENPPVAPQEKSRLGCWSVLWWCIKKDGKTLAHHTNSHHICVNCLWSDGGLSLFHFYRQCRG